MISKTETNSHKNNAVIVGILFVIATLFLFVGDYFYNPVLETAEFLQVAYPNRMAAVIGILIEFSCILAIPLIPVFAFPVLRKHSETLAIGYVVFRLFEAVLFVLVDITKLTLTNVSQLFLDADPSTAALIENIGWTIQGWNEWAWVFYVFIFGFGAVLFYTLLFRSRLLPRWISVWGLIAAAMIIAGAAMSMFEIQLPDALLALLQIPIGLQEMVMAVWLIFKGFSENAT
jgi:hypothetical protein